MHIKKWFYAFVALTLSVPAWGLESEPFSNERFAELQADGELVLIDIFAPWCPTCARQHEVLKAYRAAHPDVDLHILGSIRISQQTFGQNQACAGNPAMNPAGSYFSTFRDCQVEV